MALTKKEACALDKLERKINKKPKTDWDIAIGKYNKYISSHTIMSFETNMKWLEEEKKVDTRRAD